MSSRANSLREIERSLGAALHTSTSNALVAAGDSAAILSRLPDQCVSLVLTDPPYHVTKKTNIYGDKSFEHDEHYLEWLQQYVHQWKRILKPNGSLFCFCASSMSARLELMLSREFNVLAHVVWTKPNDPGFDGWKGKMSKENLRQWYNHSERVLFAEPARDGNLHRSPFAAYLREQRRAAGLTAHELTEIIGAYGAVNHGGAVSNWETGRNIPSREQYSKICEAIVSRGRVRSMLAYEDAVRPFFVDSTVEFTDVWSFPSVRPYKGKHPAEKPDKLLEHAIAATTYPGDIVLDCFAGSGSTAVAALRLERRSISIEIEAKWVDRIAERVKETDGNADFGLSQRRAEPKPKRRPPPSLFDERS